VSSTKRSCACKCCGERNVPLDQITGWSCRMQGTPWLGNATQAYRNTRIPYCADNRPKTSAVRNAGRNARPKSFLYFFLNILPACDRVRIRTGNRIQTLPKFLSRGIRRLKSSPASGPWYSSHPSSKKSSATKRIHANAHYQVSGGRSITGGFSSGLL